MDRLVRTGLIPALVWGCEINGLSPRCLLLCRRMARAAARRITRGRSLDLSLALLTKGTDPADKGMTSSIITWKAAMLDSWAPQLWMHVAMEKAIKVVDHPDEEDDWKAVAGPAGAVVASGRRLGWTFVSAAEFATHRGRHMWSSTSMGEMRVLLEESVEIWRWDRAKGQRIGH